eukprot:TRINITY_DN65435_c0_g1_i1.p1 TRINITY_DN65435_c0_g1~~TRINITY_DN65435_c0_g1_i1.p1  ORF type:complete len:511 (+),score=110.45 TRINITY_DN65435_c0_g1_i1:72-1535(+)
MAAACLQQIGRLLAGDERVAEDLKRVDPEAALAYALRGLRDVGCCPPGRAAVGDPEDAALLTAEVAGRAVRAAHLSPPPVGGPQQGDALLRAAGCRFAYDAPGQCARWETARQPAAGDVSLRCGGVDYRLRGCLGLGARGCVLRCDDPSGGCSALKLHYDAARCTEAAQHLVNEVRSLLALRGAECVPQLRGFGVVLGVPCVVTDAAPGLPLSSRAWAAGLRAAGSDRAAACIVGTVEGLLAAFTAMDRARVSCWDSVARNVVADIGSNSVAVVDFGEASQFNAWRGSAPPGVPEEPPQHPIIGGRQLEEEEGRFHNEHALRHCMQAVAEAAAAAPLPAPLASAVASFVDMHDRATGRAGYDAGVGSTFGHKLPTGRPSDEYRCSLTPPLTVAAVRSLWQRVWPGGLQQAERAVRSAAARDGPPNPDRDTPYDSYEGERPRGSSRGGRRRSQQEAEDQVCDELAALRMRCKAVSQRLSRRAAADPSR